MQILIFLLFLNSNPGNQTSEPYPNTHRFVFWSDMMIEVQEWVKCLG